MKSSSVGYDTLVSLYKCGQSGASGSSVSDSAKSALMSALGGAGLGAGLGFLTHAIMPKDEDEDLRDRLLTHILTGAALGGLAGYGGRVLSRKVAPLVASPEPKGPVARTLDTLDPSLGTVVTAGGAGTGIFASTALADIYRAHKLKQLRQTLKTLGPEGSQVSTGLESFLKRPRVPGKNGLLPTQFKGVEDAFAKTQTGRPFWKFWQRHDKALDRNLVEELYKVVASSKGKPLSASKIDKIIGGANPRKILQMAGKRPFRLRTKGKALLWALGLLTAGAALRGVEGSKNR